MKVALLGGSGFVGTALAQALRDRGDVPVVISLRDPQRAAQEAVECSTIVNLAGEPIAQRWTAPVKQRILESRTVAPRSFLQELGRMHRRATIYVSASAIDYYGSSRDTAFDEDSPPGKTFLANVCVAWEQQAKSATTLGMRVACVRAGLVLGNGGLLASLLPLFRAGLGGRIGDGKAWYSWVHITDLVGIYLSAMDEPNVTMNAVALNPVTNEEFVRALGERLGRPTWLPTPAFALRAALGEGAGVLLERQRVAPARALERGYRFRFPELAGALADLL